MSLAWPSISKSFGATGRFLWRDEPVDASLSLGDLFAAIAGDRAGLKVRLTSTPAKIAFDGHVSHRSRLRVEGTLAADGASMRDTLRWVGQKPLPGAGFGRFARKAQTNVVGGTLAAEGLDLSPYLSTLRLVTGSERDWNRVPLALDWLSAFDVDIRLSAARVTMASAKLGRTAIAANLRSGRLTVAVGESQAFDGIIKGSFGVAKSETGAELKAQLQFADVDLDACIGELFGIRRLEGRGSLNVALDAQGSSVLELTRTLNGSASLNGSKGAVTGLNVEQLLRRLERRPLSGGNEFRSGRTPFDKLAVAFRVSQGLATVEDVRIEGPAVRLALNGAASIPARDLDLKGTASLVATASDSTAFELPFVVQGSWDDPIILPDLQTLIRRSPSGAPLLDAVRRNAGDNALSKAIKQLTGGSNAAPAGEPAAEATAEPKPNP
jgi:AsmA protein